MAEITLSVTQAVLDYAKGPREKERQIAYSAPSADVAARLATVSAKDGAQLRLGDLMTLVVADRGAIWRAHSAEHVADFDALFELLSRYPSRKMRFLCAIVG